MFLRCFFAAAIKDICLKACVKISQPILIYYIIEIIGGILHIISGAQTHLLIKICLF